MKDREILICKLWLFCEADPGDKLSISGCEPMNVQHFTAAGKRVKTADEVPGIRSFFAGHQNRNNKIGPSMFL